MSRNIIAVIVGILIGLIFSAELHSLFFKMKVGPYGEYLETIEKFNVSKNKVQTTNPFSAISKYPKFGNKGDVPDMVEIVQKMSIFNLFTVFIVYCILAALVASLIAKDKRWLIGLIVVLPVSVLPILIGTNILIANVMISILYLAIGVLIGFGISLVKKKGV